MRYDYRCDDCGAVKEFTLSMRAPVVKEKCSECGGAMTRLLGIQTQATLSKLDRKWPIRSNSLPLNMPGVECASDGRPIIQSRAHARQVARSGGYEY